jgi:hypothetical protein
MILAVILLCEVYVFVFLLPWHLGLILCAIYLLWYLDPKEHTGERHWPAFRRFFVWPHLSPVEWTIGEPELKETDSARIFLLYGTRFHSTLMWGIGLNADLVHRGQFVHFMLPPAYFWIPIVRDVLLWMGAVTYSVVNESVNRESVLMKLLESRRSVAIVHEVAEEVGLLCMEENIMTLAREKNIQIVPVAVNNEDARFWSWESHRRVTCAGYTFPNIRCFRCYAPAPPPRISLTFCAGRNSRIYTSNTQLSGEIDRSIEAVKID